MMKGGIHVALGIKNFGTISRLADTFGSKTEYNNIATQKSLSSFAYVNPTKDDV